MYLSEVRVWNFRQIGTVQREGQDDLPGLILTLKKGLNVIVGENDAGKSTVIDAIRLVLWTQGREFNRVDYEDFHLPEGADESERSLGIRIECIITDISPDDGKDFLEWLGPATLGDGSSSGNLTVVLEASREQRKVYTDYFAGPSNKPLTAKARELLRATYLKPLRDAESELLPRRGSRLSQILDNHEVFLEKEDHQMVGIMREANSKIMQYFKGQDENGLPLPDLRGKELLEQINTYLKVFSEHNRPLQSYFSISDNTLRNILEKLGLQLSEDKAGLGSLNMLFIATELLLLKRDTYNGLKLGLIEEIESHLHPQAQLRLIEYLQESVPNDSTQLILTTHSPNLASKITVKNLIVFKNGSAFDMGPNSTMLREGDYLFLERFLDVTKANLFFAQGIILVEGDSENLLIPTIAKIIGVPLAKHGVSVINVGSTAFLRYAGIFKRSNTEENMGVPVAVVTDCDVETDSSPEEVQRAIEQKRKLYDGQTVKTFVSPAWTLEYVLANSSLQEEFFKAVLYAGKIKNSEDYGLTEEKRKEADEEVLEYLSTYKGDVAFSIFQNHILDKNVSKPTVAQCFISILLKKEQEALRKQLESDSMLEYLVDAIKYAGRIPREGDAS